MNPWMVLVAMSLPKLTAFDCIWPFFSVESDVSAQDARDHQQSMTLPMCDVVVSCLRANALVNGARVNNRKSDFVCVWRNAFEETESTVCHRPSSSLPRKWTEKNQSRFTLENKSKRERERAEQGRVELQTKGSFRQNNTKHRNGRSGRTKLQRKTRFVS